eukprot:SAG22_NODE_7495_length_734_cov_2.222047_2_plen_142_part_00
MSNLTIGKIANNSITLVLKSVLHAGLGNDGTMRFSVDIPNHMGAIIAGKSRCLLQVQSVTVARVRVLSGHADGVSSVDNNYRTPLSCGVRISGLASLELINLSSDTPLLTELSLTSERPEMKPVIIKMRLLFLDEEDLKDF